MYSLIEISRYIYAATFLLSAAFTVVLLKVGNRQKITYYLLMFGMITISNLGYFGISCATNLETAFWANTVMYLGGIFSPLFLCVSIFHLCDIKYPRWALIPAVLYDFGLMMLIASAPYHNLYYSSVELVVLPNASYMRKVNGPLHKLYTFMLIAYAAVMLAVVIHSLFRKRKTSYRNAVTLLVMELLTMFGYVIQRVTHSTIEWVSIFYLIDEIIILALIRRIGMYDVNEVAKEAIAESDEYGFAAFDGKKRYLGCNGVMMKYFPEISSLKIDYTISAADSDSICVRMMEWIDGYERGNKTETHYATSGDRVFKCTVRYLTHGRKKEHVGYLIEFYDDTVQQKYINLLNDYKDRLEEEVAHKVRHITRMQDNIILGMAELMGNRDDSTGGHVKRTSDVIKIYVNALRTRAEEYQFSEEFLSQVIKAAPMHDLGKISVDDKILKKPGKYTPEEYAEMKKHAAKGAEIVHGMLAGIEDEEFVRVATNIAHYHHERWDGTGYPTGIGYLDIPPEARIMAVADVFDALVSKRCYKEKMNYDQAFQIIEESEGTHFDPEYAKLFISCRPQLEAYYDSLSE